MVTSATENDANGVLASTHYYVSTKKEN